MTGNGHNGAENHISCQNHYFLRPDELLPYIVQAFGDGCSIAGVQRDYPLTRLEIVEYRNGGATTKVKFMNVGVGDFDLLVAADTSCGRQLVPVEIKGSEQHDLGSAKSQLAGYKKAIREGVVLQPINDEEVRYGLVIRGCPPDVKIDLVDLEEELGCFH